MDEDAPCILIAEDEPAAREALAELISDEGFRVESASDGEQALAQVEALQPSVVLTDLKMPKLDGIELIRRGKEISPHSAFVVMTAFGSIDTALEAVRAGAINYLTKPLNFDSVVTMLRRAAEQAALSREAATLRRQLDQRFDKGQIIGSHPSWQALLKQVEQVGPSRATVLIEGASGTGKELLAAAIHRNSSRRDKPFVRVNCAALAENLLESELFGHERGAFTGAVERRAGRFEQADGGTLFLDEIGEVPMAAQVKLLRVLQEQEFERVGGTRTLRVDVRIVAATHRDLKARVRDKAFREDLFFRLNVVKLEVPPLCVRKSDIPLLAQHFLKKFNEDNGLQIQGFTDAALHALSRYPWPGNVRELENAIERAVVLCTEPRIDADLLPGDDDPSAAQLTLPADVTLADAERLLVAHTLDRVDGNKAEAAELLKVSEERLGRILRQSAPPEA